MAPPALGVCRQALRVSHRTQWLSYRRQCPASMPPPRALAVRSFSATPTTRREDGESKPPASHSAPPPSESSPEETVEVDNAPYFNDTFYASLYSSAKDAYLRSAPWERRLLESLHGDMASALGPDSDTGHDLDALVERTAQEAKDTLGPSFFERPERALPYPQDFSTMEDPERDIAPDEVFEGDDISSLAHAQLDTHREMREYSRLAAWEMPLLSTLALPFQKPTATTPLRWRYTTYLGTPHPAAHKVVLTFKPLSLPLPRAAVAKLIKLAGPRYDPHRREVKMASEAFPSQAQNKRLLGRQLAALVAEAQDTADTLEDVPFDFRHARRAKRAVFPKEWALTDERRGQLRRRWEESKGRDELAEGQAGGKIQGAKVIEAARAQQVADVLLEGAGKKVPVPVRK